jgi:hypothetical protein
MAYVYIVVENSDEEPEGGGVFPTMFPTFEKARAAIITKYQDVLYKEREEVGENDMASDVFVVEEEKGPTGFTRLYIEKGIHFYIHKFKLPNSGGKRRSSRSASRSRK